MRRNTLLMAKLSWLLLLVGEAWTPLHGPITPGAGLLTVIPGGLVWLAGAFWGGGVCLLCNRAVRGACVASGGAVLLAPLESITAWQPYAWVCGGVLLLCALQGPGEKPRFVRRFVVLVHGAAALGAIDGAEWITTALAAPWVEQDFLGTVPRWIAGFLPAGALAQVLFWGTVVVCSAIPLGLIVPRMRRAAAGLAVWFYISLYVALGSTEVVLFAGAIGIAQISCLDWPRFIVVLWPRACGWPLFLRIALDRYDFEHRIDWPRPPNPDADLEAWFDERPVAGAKAIVNLVLASPMFYFAMLATITAVHALLPRFVAVATNSTLALTLVGFSVVASMRDWRAQILHRPPPNALTADDARKAIELKPGPVAGDTNITAEIDTPPPPDR